MKRAIFYLVTSSILAAGAVQAESASFSSYSFACDTLTSTNAGGCPGIIDKKVNGPFNFGLWNNKAYDIATVWVRARVDGKSSWTDVNKHGGNIPHNDSNSSGANGVVFQFNEQWLMGKLNADDVTLKEGFEFTLKIKSVGAGSGLQAKCHHADVKWDSNSNQWVWRKGGDKNASWHAISDHKTYMWKVDGSVNDVKCGLKNAGGSKVSNVSS